MVSAIFHVGQSLLFLNVSRLQSLWNSNLCSWTLTNISFADTLPRTHALNCLLLSYLDPYLDLYPLHVQPASVPTHMPRRHSHITVFLQYRCTLYILNYSVSKQYYRKGSKGVRRKVPFPDCPQLKTPNLTSVRF